MATTKFTNAAISSTGFTVTPNLQSEMGYHDLKLILTDGCSGIKEYPFRVNVANTKPYWVVTPDPNNIEVIEMKINELLTYKIASTDVKDD